jgi:hypothetical protein
VTQNFDVSPVAPLPLVPLLPYELPTFVFRWFFTSQTVEIWEPTKAPSDPKILINQVASGTLPLPILKTETLGDWNKVPPSVVRNTHHVMMGENPVVGPSSVFGSTRFADDRDPYLYVWDWRAGQMHGPLVLPESTRQIEGPVKIGDHLYFTSLRESDLKPRLYRTQCNLEHPTESGIGAEQLGSAGGVVTKPIELMMATKDFIAVLDNPGNANSYSSAHVWDVFVPGVPTVPSVSVGEWRYLRSVRDQPGQVLSTTDSFLLPYRFPRSLDDVTPTAITGTSLAAGWGGGVGDDFTHRPWTVLADGNTIIYSFASPGPQGWISGVRTWRTGAVLEAESIFDLDDAGDNFRSIHFPFEV